VRRMSVGRSLRTGHAPMSLSRISFRPSITCPASQCASTTQWVQAASVCTTPALDLSTAAGQKALLKSQAIVPYEASKCSPHLPARCNHKRYPPYHHRRHGSARPSSEREQARHDMD
jgi:hypothetical protein